MGCFYPFHAKRLPTSADARAGGWWIDDCGNWRAFDTGDNDTRDGDPFATAFDQRVAFLKYGLVRAAFERRRFCVQWDIAKADRAAIETVKSHLKSNYAGETCLRFRYGGWCTENYATPDDALRRIEEIDNFRQSPATGLIAVDRHDLNEIDTAKPLLRAAHHAWQANGTAAIDGPDSKLRPLFDYLQIFEQRPDDGFLVFRAVGHKSVLVRFLGPGWAHSVIGSLFHRGHEDHEFEDMIRLSYDEAQSTEKPIFEHIRALTNMTDRESEWFSYQRLLLPCRLKNGNCGIAVMTAEDQDVSIPFLKASGA